MIKKTKKTYWKRLKKSLVMLIGFFRKQDVIHVLSNVPPFRSAAWFYTKMYGYVLRESTNKINRLATKTNQKKKQKMKR